MLVSAKISSGEKWPLNRALVRYRLTQHPRLEAQLLVMLFNLLKMTLKLSRVAFNPCQDNADVDSSNPHQPRRSQINEFLLSEQTVTR